MGLRRDAPLRGAQSTTTRQEREDAGIGSGRMISTKLIAGDRHYCSRNSIGLELCKCHQGPLTRMLDTGG